MSVIFSPFTKIVPSVKLNNPTKQWASVVFPEPFPPTIEIFSPLRIEKFNFEKAEISE
ncbi:hypothetical protein D9M71_748430 [compost metagenome]